MATYRPVTTTITSASISSANGAKVNRAISNHRWNLAFLYGTAIAKSGAVVLGTLPSGTVLGWYSTKIPSEGNADIQTFADSEARYGVTVNTGKAVQLAFYAHG